MHLIHINRINETKVELRFLEFPRKPTASVPLLPRRTLTNFGNLRSDRNDEHRHNTVDHLRQLRRNTKTIDAGTAVQMLTAGHRPDTP